MGNDKAMMAEFEAMKKELEQEKAKRAEAEARAKQAEESRQVGITMKPSKAGKVSIYGLQKLPVTLAYGVFVRYLDWLQVPADANVRRQLALLVADKSGPGGGSPLQLSKTDRVQAFEERASQAKAEYDAKQAKAAS